MAWHFYDASGRILYSVSSLAATKGSETVASAPGDSVSHGASNDYAATDHRHAREAAPTADLGIVNEDFYLKGDITPTQLSANTDDWSPTGLADAAVIRASTDASRNLTGLAGGSDGRIMLLINVGSNDLVIMHDVTSTAANRFLCPASDDITLGANMGVVLQYDATSSRWRVIGGTGSGGSVIATDSDGSVTVDPATTLKFDDGLVTDEGGGVARIRGLPAGTIGCKVHRVSDLTFTTGVGQVVPFTATDIWDTDGFHDPSGANPERATIPTGLGGHYLAIATTRWNPNSTGSRSINVLVNGAVPGGSSEVDRVSSPPTNSMGHSQVVMLPNLVAGDIVTVSVFQGSGGDLDLLDATLTLVKLDSGRVGTGIGASVTSDVAQNGVTVDTAKLFELELFDTDGFHSTSSNTERLTIPAGLGGKYIVTGTMYLGNISAASYVGIRLRKNGATVIVTRNLANTGDNILNISHVLDLAAGDYLELVSTSDDASYDLAISGDAPVFSIMRLDSLPSDTGGSWQSYTPVLTNGTVGNGTIAGRWKYVDAKTILWRIDWLLGSTSSISGQLAVSLPLTISGTVSQSCYGYCYDNGTAYFAAVGVMSSTTVAGIANPDTAGTKLVTGTSPFTWTTNDRLVLQGYFELP